MISTVLRAMAAHLEDTVADCFGDGRSPYICDCLWADMWQDSGFGPADRYVALQFLHYLGMGSGFHEFLLPSEDLGAFNEAGSKDFILDVQSRRVAWLLFAADLADEWGVRSLRDFG